MIGELRKKMSRELTLVLAERGRSEETALSTDLWKRPVSWSKVTSLLKFSVYSVMPLLFVIESWSVRLTFKPNQENYTAIMGLRINSTGSF